MTGPATMAVMGCDLGGTKLIYAVFPVAGGRIGRHSVAQGEVPTEKGEAGLEATMRRAYQTAVAAAPGYAIAAIGVGSPGRNIATPEAGGRAFIAAPASAKNLAPEDNQAALDHKDLQKVLQGTIPVPVFMDNDGPVQMRAMLDELLGKDGTAYHGKKVGYIGMGTGLGGGFGQVNKQGEVFFYTDAHIYDFRLEMKRDMERIKEIDAGLEAKRKFQFDETRAFIRAEDILSGTAFTKLSGRKGNGITTAAQAEEVRPVLEIMGRGLAELVVKIHRGDFEKLNPRDNWPAEDLRKVKETTHFLMGGGVANNPHLMHIIVDTAQAELAAQGIDGIKFISVPEREITRAGAALVPQHILSQSL